MADVLQINVSGLVTVRVDAGDGLETLGHATDQPSETDQAFHHDVHGDEHGGPQGPPIDIQYLGRVIRVRAEMSKYNRAVLQKLRARLKSNGVSLEGTIQTADIGALMIQDGKSMRVLLKSASDPKNFPLCIIREPIETNYGTKYSSLIMEFEAHRNQTTGVIFNTAAS